MPILFLWYILVVGGDFLFILNASVPLDWLDWFSVIGTIFSIISVGITIYLTYSTQNIKEKVKTITNLKTFQKDKKTLINELRSCKDLFDTDEVSGIRDLSRIIRLLEEYRGFMNKNDSTNLMKLKKSVNTPKKRNKDEIVICINYLIGFLELNIDNTYKNI